ncbi:MAG: hypothetical protein HZB20_08010 [Chloroflexi bacterium]|nr:hypothetical protein [Chloroflexota bacterium]
MPSITPSTEPMVSVVRGGPPSGDGLPVGKNPQAGGDEAERDPAQRPGVNVGHQHFAIKVNDIETVEDAYADGEGEDQQPGLQEQFDLTAELSCLVGHCVPPLDYSSDFSRWPTQTTDAKPSLLTDSGGRRLRALSPQRHRQRHTRRQAEDQIQPVGDIEREAGTHTGAIKENGAERM